MFKRSYEIRQEEALFLKHRPVNDVLNVDIKGTGFMKAIKRLYRDIFLLSYEDRRCWEYYITVRSMVRERARHYRNYPDTIHPFSKFRAFWDYFILILCVTKQVLFTYNTSVFINELDYYAWYIGFFCEFFMIIDLFISSKTGYVDEDTRTVILDPKSIVIKFFSTKVFLHAMGAIPLHMIVFLRVWHYDRNKVCTLCNTSIFVTVLRFFSTLSLVRCYHASTFLTRVRNHFGYTTVCRFIRILVLYFLTTDWILSIHFTIYMLEIIRTNEVTQIATSDYIAFWYGLHRPACHHMLDLLQHITQSFFLIRVNVQSDDANQMITGIVAYVASNLFYIWAFLLAFDITGQVFFSEYYREIIEERTLNLIRCHQLPDEMEIKVKTYYNNSEAKASVIEKENGLFEALPISLKDEIRLSCNSRLLSRIPHFDELPSNILNEIVLLLEEEIYMTGDVISKKGLTGDGLLILDKGVVAVYSEQGEELEHLIDGDYLHLMSLFADAINTNTIVSVTDSKILFLDKVRFRKLMRNDPLHYYKLRQKLGNSDNLINIRL